MMNIPPAVRGPWQQAARILLIICLSHAFVPGGVLPAAAAKEPKVLLIGIDGLRVDAFQAAATPALDALAEGGMIDLQTNVISTAVTNSDTISGPGWTTFLTGVWADRHGVTDNSFQGRDREAAPHCFTLAKSVKPKLQTASFLDWTPLNEHVTRDADINVVVTPHSRSAEYDGADHSLALMAAAVLGEQPVDLAFVYFGSVDETGHKHGFHPSVKAYIDRIEAIDHLVGKLVDAVRARPSIEDEDWLFIVSTDHGGEGLGHGGGRENPMIYRVPMIVSGAAAARGNDVARPVATTDIVAIALTHLGIPHDPDWALAGSAEGWLKATERQ